MPTTTGYAIDSLLLCVPEGWRGDVTHELQPGSGYTFALSVNALWALRAGRWGWRCGPVGLGWGAIVLGITFLALLRQVALEPCS